MTPPFLSKTLEKLKLDRRLQQQVLFYGATALGVALVGVCFYYWNISGVPTPQQVAKQPKSIPISNGAQNIRDEEVWVSRIEKEMGGLKSSLEEIGKVVKGLAGEKLAQDTQSLSKEFSASPQGQPASSHSTNHLATNHLTGQPTDDIGVMRNQLGSLKDVGKAAAPTVSSSKEQALALVNTKGAVTKPEIKKMTFQLDQRNAKRMGKSIDHYVPAGSFARGVLTSGVVASTSVGSSSNPRPVHIQLTNFGTLPRKFKSDIKGCFLIGTSYGDMASERVFMRLEKLSCVERKTGEVIELTVDGYVTGEDGSNGIRGVLVDRSGPALRNAFIGGFIGGVGNFFTSQQTTPLSITGGGITSLNSMNSQQLLQAGAGKGLGSSMEKMSDFYIKRAEQLQPVLEVEAGRKVDVVFTAGFDMAQTLYRRALMADNDQERRNLVSRTPSHESNFAEDRPSGLNHHASSTTQGGFYDQR